MTDRQPLAPVAGLKRTSSLPPPPPRISHRDHKSTESAASTSTTARGTSQPDAVASQQGSKTLRSTDAGMIRAISLSLPLPLAEALKERARVERITHAEVLMDAVSSQRGDLTELIDNAKPRAQTDALFTRRQRPGNAATYVALSLRMMSSNVAVLDELTQRHNADSRSQFCAVALTGYLTPLRPGSNELVPRGKATDG